MSKLKVDPSPDISFDVIGGKPSSCPLRLFNSGTDHMAFKVKTTAPKKYCVRPNAGVIPPGKHVEVHVIPQVGRGGEGILASDLQGKCKDKFMIQSTTVPVDEPLTPELWGQVPPAELGQTLLRCKYKLASTAGGESGSIPEGETTLTGVPTVSTIDVNAMDFSNADAVKAKIVEMNKAVETQALAAARKVRELQEENAKLSARPSGGEVARRTFDAKAAPAAEGFTPLFIVIVSLCTYLLGMTTSLVSLPK